MPPTKILIADDHTLVRQACGSFARGWAAFRCAEAEDGSQAVTLACTAQPDVILMDIVMPDVTAWKPSVRSWLRPRGPHHRADHVSPGAVMLDAIRAGARGYLLKTVDAGELIAPSRRCTGATTSSTLLLPAAC